MAIKKTLQIVSFGLLFYLLADSFMHFDFAASKNEAYTSMKKTEVNAIQDIDTVKQKAKDYLDIIRRVHKKHSDKAVINFWLLVGLIIIQAFLFITNNPKWRHRITAGNIGFAASLAGRWSNGHFITVVLHLGWTYIVELLFVSLYFYIFNQQLFRADEQ